MGGVGGRERGWLVSGVGRRLELWVADVIEEEVELFPVKMDLGDFIEMVRRQCAKGGNKVDAGHKHQRVGVWAGGLGTGYRSRMSEKDRSGMI